MSGVMWKEISKTFTCSAYVLSLDAYLLHEVIVALQPTYAIPDLPPRGLVETPKVLKALARAHRYLAELKGRAATIPNQVILIDTLSLQEAKASSEIENIVTTQDELFQLSFVAGIEAGLS